MVGWDRVDRSLCGARSGRAGNSLVWRRRHRAGSRLLALGLRLLADVLRVEALLARHHRPQDASVLVGHRNTGFLPAHPDHPLRQPARCRVVAFARAHHRRLRALDQQCAQLVVAPLGDPPQAGLAAAGVLARHDAQPGAELVGGCRRRGAVHGTVRRGQITRQRARPAPEPAGRCCRSQPHSDA